ncbi:MAG: hypothetical protein II997_07885 [Clostridia bacterium]|nr:hypothetical protein [Clostridia bacterium]
MYGKFIENTAGYEINTFDLPTSWEYIYENKDILLKVDQFGPAYAQANPPGDIVLFKREQHQKYSPWLVHIVTESGECFSNFFKPYSTAIQPENVRIQYLPECARYGFSHNGLRFETEIFIPDSGIKVIYKFKAKNTTDEARSVGIRPQLVPYLNQAQMTPWDKYEWYLDTKCRLEDRITVSSEVLDPSGQSEKRRCACLVSDGKELSGYEISLEKYIGFGDVLAPDMNYTNDERLYAYPPVYAFAYDWALAPGEEKELTQVFTLDDSDVGCYFEKEQYLAEKEKRKAVFDRLFSKNRINTGDEMFDYYANYWVPLQMNWVASLDRGWPTGMRGARDSAQDYTALLYTDTDACKQIIFKMLTCQRRDGWFPRQYSDAGRHGKHDLREYVDGGVFFLEFIWKYLAHTHDFDILNEELPWLDGDDRNTVLEHVIQAAEYYLKADNIGEHGLCKIREGDWLDSVNRAGLEGRGESVTVSQQLVMGLTYLANILNHIHYRGDIQKYLTFAERLAENINQHAFNGAFYNGCFNDNGQWIFSQNDPDGEERQYAVSNYYAVIAGVAKADKYEHVLNVAESLRCDMGYRLFYPPLGGKPIEKVGRIASGDTPPFMIENGNVYNHGSQGFLARALAVMGEGEKLLDVLKWIMPYDQSKHPTEKVLTSPYAITNCYQQLPSFENRSLMCFLTGSIAMAVRGVYEWMFGIKPALDGLEIAPCLPAGMDCAQAEFAYMGKQYNLSISGDKVFLNGKELMNQRPDLITGKMVWYISTESEV